jgi:hypothetical protein
MTKKDLIEKNMDRLCQCNPDKLMNRLSVRDVDGESTGLLNIMIDKQSGEILDLSHKMPRAENAITIPILLKKKDLLDETEKARLELLSDLEKEIPTEANDVVKESLHLFNQRS